LANITIPSLILWGRENKYFLPELAQEAYNLLGTNEADKELIFFNNAAHELFKDVPEEVISEIEFFVDKYKE